MTLEDELRPLAVEIAKSIRAELSGGTESDLPEIRSASADRPALLDQDLKRWETKALRAHRAGRSANVHFESQWLDSRLKSAVSARLALAASPADVKAAFGEDVLRTAALAKLEQLIDGELAARLDSRTS